MKGNHTVSKLTHCARCDQTHFDLIFKPFTRPCEAYTHFAICPVTGEPILLQFTPDKTKRKKT